MWHLLGMSPPLPRDGSLAGQPLVAPDSRGAVPTSSSHRLISSLHLQDHSPAGAVRAVNADLALPHQSPGNHLHCPTRWLGWRLTFFTSPSKHRTESPQVPPPGPYEDLQVQGSNREQVTADFCQVLEPILSSGSHRFSQFHEPYSPWTGWSLHQATGGFEFKEFTEGTARAIPAGMIWAMRALQTRTSSIYITLYQKLMTPNYMKCFLKSRNN